MTDKSKAAKPHLSCPCLLVYLEKRYWSSSCWWPLLPWDWDWCQRASKVMWSGKGRGGEEGEEEEEGEEKCLTWVVAVSCEYEQQSKRGRRNVLPGQTRRQGPFSACYLNCIIKFLSVHSSVSPLAAQACIAKQRRHPTFHHLISLFIASTSFPPSCHGEHHDSLAMHWTGLRAGLGENNKKDTIFTCRKAHLFWFKVRVELQLIYKVIAAKHLLRWLQLL